MIKSIDEQFCIGCGLCTNLCPEDVLRMKNGKAYIVYPGDCSHCLECFVYCPTEAVIMGRTAVPKKLDASVRWQQIKETLNLK
jgi:NAD-dependent dihydropyrimidine dehydrogenase PreA subunit